MSVVPLPGGDAVPLHHRAIDYRAWIVDDGLVVVGRLTDTRPWVDDGVAVSTVHDLELRVRVRTSDLTITAATAEMYTFPHTECPTIEAAFEGLVGLNVARGYTREVQSRFGGPRGCTHLEHLARSLGPVVIQAVTSRRAQSVSRGESPDLLAAGGEPAVRGPATRVTSGRRDPSPTRSWPPAGGRVRVRTPRPPW